jgi:type I restriction enzyme S subunit
LHLAKEAVPSFAFALPPAQLVREFDSLANPVLNRIQAADEQSEAITILRDTLLPKLLSGELRVKDVDRLMEAHS